MLTFKKLVEIHMKKYYQRDDIKAEKEYEKKIKENRPKIRPTLGVKRGPYKKTLDIMRKKENEFKYIK